MADIFGFDLKQDGAASGDIRNLMSEQLNELRMMRAEVQKQSSGGGGGGQVPQANPFIMNPLYTEHHSKNIDSAMAMMQSQNSIRNDMTNSPLKNLAQFANENGYFSMRYGGGIVDGRGYSAKDIEVAKVRTEGRIVDGILDKASGALGFGAGMAGGSAATGFTTAIMGMGALSMPAIGVGLGAGFLAEKAAKEGIEEIQTYYDYKEKFTAGSDRFIAPGEGTNPYGGGFTKKEIKRASKFMTSLNSEFNLKDAELSEFYNAASENNLMKGAQDIESFEKMMTKLTDMSKKYAKVLGKSMSEVAGMMGELKHAGISTDGYAAVFNVLDNNSALLGMTAEQYVTSVSDRTSQSTFGTSANASVVAASIVKQDGLIGGVMNAMSNIRSEDPSYDLANYISNMGADGFASALGNAVGQDATLVDHTVLMASYDQKTGNVDPKRVKELLAQMKKGEIDMKGVSDLANDKKDIDIFAFEGAASEFRSQNALLSVEATVSTALASSKITMEEFLGMSDDDKISTLMKTGKDALGANALVATIASTNGNIEKAGEGMYNSSRLGNKLKGLSNNWTDTFTNMFNNGEKELANLYNYEVDKPIDYSKKMTYSETRKAMKFGYASLTSGLGETEADIKARDIVQGAVYAESFDKGWEDDGTAFTGRIAKKLVSRLGGSDTLSDSLTKSANELGLSEAVNILKSVKTGATEFGQKDVEGALTQIMQADSDGYLSKEATAGNNAMMSAIDKNTEAQIEVVKTITKKFENTTAEITGLMDSYIKFSDR